jgi:hypothetical protein
MKLWNLVIGTMVATVMLMSCEDSNLERVMTDAEAERHVLDKIEKNEGISYNLFNTLEQIGADSLKRLKSASPSKADFISLLGDQTLAYFDDVVKMSKADFAIAAPPTPFAGEAEITLKVLAGREETAGAAPSLNHVDDYSKHILKLIEEQADDGHKDWILLSSFQTGSSEPRQLPTETFSLNYEEIKMLATVPHTVILNPELSDEEVLKTLNDIMNSHDIPPVAIALLLPAVQKVREAASSSKEPFGDAMIAWLDETVEPAIGGGLDRDIIRRIQATVFLAGLHTVILPEYPNANQDTASLSVLHARYRAALIMACEELWGD